MDYNTYQSTSGLETLVKCYWTLSIPRDVPKGRQQILPDGCMDMIFNLGDDVKRIVSDDEYLIQPRSFILGQISKPFWIEPTGAVETFAVRFYPGCFSYFSKTSMTSLADRDTELKQLFPVERITQLEADITNSTTVAIKIKIVEAFLITILEEAIDVDDLLNSTIDRMLESKGTIGVNEILQEQQGKRRQLERRFSKQVGVSPKQLCRMIRLQSSLKAMLDGKKNLTDIGYDNDYYDQAHFIRDFKDFTGVSPKEFYKEEKFKLSSVFYTED